MNSKEIQGLIEYVENPDNRMQDGYHVTDVEMLNIVMNKLKRLVSIFHVIKLDSSKILVLLWINNKRRIVSSKI